MKVSQPSDVAEIEADLIADTVMGMPDTAVPPIQNSSTAPNTIHRKCDTCEEDEDEEPVLRKVDTEFALPPEEPPPGRGKGPPKNMIPGAGSPLDEQTREFFEPRFGASFSHVRIHTGSDASGSAKSLRARAYTYGSDIVFAAGEYQPSTNSGRHLLAHELAHVTQATAGRVMRQADEGFDALFESPGTVSGGSSSNGTTAGCPKVPTGLGDREPHPPCPKATHIGTKEVDRVKFCLDSDHPLDFSELDRIHDLVKKHHRATRFIVHGYASPEGRVDYNFNLAGHRANQVADELRRAIRTQVEERTPDGDDAEQRLLRVNAETDAEIQGRIETGAQGPTGAFGDPAENRLAIVYAQEPGGTADEEPGCPDARRGMGNITPEVPCDVPSVDLTGIDGSDQLAHFHFCLDSDVLNQTTPTKIAKFAMAQASKATFVVHGFSSTEGAADYNQRLSCHRALRVARELLRAGVRSEQIREVSGLGETDKFHDPDLNRVVIVRAEEGAVGEMPAGTRPATTEKEKRAIVEEARKRISNGEYNLAADEYISFWTCGRTRTIAAAVERLTINVRKENSIELEIPAARGEEEGLTVNTVRVSNATLMADNAIECTMGRLIDMSFHHAEIGHPDLNTNKDLRHSAGLHLIHLAGLGACKGERVEFRKSGVTNIGIEPPLEADPRSRDPNEKNKKKKVPPVPPCAQVPDATRLHFPSEGAKGRERPAFNFADDIPPRYSPATGKWDSNFKAGVEGNSPILLTRPTVDILKAEAEVQLDGDPSTFSDYEVGFIQSVIGDETQTDYDTGHSVIQELPTPIRHAHLRGEIPAPEPWTTPDAMAIPGSDGLVKLSTNGIGLNAETAIKLSILSGELPEEGGMMTQFEKSTRLAIWLVARRRGAPLDRFSIHFIDGVTYDVTQTGHIEHRHVRGAMFVEPIRGFRETLKTELGGEGEVAAIRGGFHASKPTELPADPSAMRFRGPASSEISLRNQIRRIVGPPAPGATAMGREELRNVVIEILDNLEVFPGHDEAVAKEGATKAPRLGFDFIPLTITMQFNKSSGRIRIGDGKTVFTRIKGPGLGHFVGVHLAKALEFRMHHHGVVAGDIVVNPGILQPITDDEGKAQDEGFGAIAVTIPPRKRDAEGKPETESDLLKRPDVLRDMAEASTCSANEIADPFSFGREFGKAYAMDRDKTLIPVPSDRLAVSPEGDGEVIELNLPCAAPGDGVNLGRFHTHPDVKEPSPKDISSMEACGGPAVQHFIVFENQVFRIRADGGVTPMNVTLPSGVQCAPKNFEDDKRKKKTEEE